MTLTQEEIQNSLTQESIALKIEEIEMTIDYVDSILEWCDVVGEIGDTHIIVDWNVIEDMIG